MRNAWLLTHKELREIFTSPLIYILAAIFCLLMGWLFFNYLVLAQNISQDTISRSVLIPIFGNMNFIFVFLCPLLAMKLFSEEKKLKTIELLFTSNLSHLNIIWGKFLATMISVLFMLSFTLVFPIILSFSGYDDWGVVVMSYLGIILSVMCYLSVCMFASSITDNQIVAALLGFFILMALMLVVLSANASNNYILGQFFKYLSVAFHYEKFVRGELRSFNIVYYFSFIGFFFYLTKRSLESRRW